MTPGNCRPGSAFYINTWQNKAGEIDYSDPIGLRDPRVDTTTGRVNPSVGYEFTTDVDGWVAINGDALVWNADETITHNSSVIDPYIVKGDVNAPPELTIDGDTYNQIYVRAKSGDAFAEWDGAFRWFEPSGAFDNTRVAFFANPFTPISMGDPWRIIHFDMSGYALWTGTIAGLRFDFFRDVSELDIDYIRIEKRF